jgi:hypothetical protein
MLLGYKTECAFLSRGWKTMYPDSIDSSLTLFWANRGGTKVASCVGSKGQEQSKTAGRAAQIPKVRPFQCANDENKNDIDNIVKILTLHIRIST